jgi:hypothetical protein
MPESAPVNEQRVRAAARPRQPMSANQERT